MALRDIKRRIKTTGNMRQITKAMEAVSASKMRKSQLAALGARLYSVKALEILANLGNVARNHWFFSENKSDKIGILLVTSDKGLCGGYNAAVLKKADNLIKSHPRDFEFIAVGKKATSYLKRRNYNVNGEFISFGDYAKPEETSPVARLISDRYKKGKYKEVWTIYTNFISTLKQEAALRKILPVDINFVKEIIEGVIPRYGKFSEKRKNEPGFFIYEYVLEPSPDEIFNTLIPSLFEIMIHHIILESNASEHSARMVAMRNASQNASDILKELALSYNKARQSEITKELLEVIAGKEALEN